MHLHLLLIFLFLSTCSFAQSYAGKPIVQHSTTWDPEQLWHLKDSLNKIDTLQFPQNRKAYYAQQYLCDFRLFQFDNKPWHLVNGLKWTNGQIAHDSLTQKLCTQGLYCATSLEDSTLARSYLNLLKQYFPPEKWSDETKRQVNLTNLQFLWEEYENEPVFDFGSNGISCDLDTNLLIHSKKKLQRIPDRFNRYEPELTEGDSSYAEFRVHTKNCRCRDCEYATRILIRLDNGVLPQSLNIDETNTVLTVFNVWKVDSVVPVTGGKFFRNEYGTYLILYTKIRPDDDHNLVEFYWFSPGKLNGL